MTLRRTSSRSLTRVTALALCTVTAVSTATVTAATADPLGSLSSLLPGSSGSSDGSEEDAPLTLATEPAPQSETWSAEYQGTYDLEDADIDEATSEDFKEVPVGGLSGLDATQDTDDDGDTDEAAGRYLALSDDRGEEGPARAYPLDLTLGDSGVDDATVGAPITLTDEDGEPYKETTVDPESIRSTDGGGFLWTSEGDRAQELDAGITQADKNGRAQISYQTPDYHHVGDGVGVRENAAYEGLTLTDDEKQAAVLTEGPLTQDSYNRLTFYDTTTGEPVREVAYQLDPADENADGRGATEILAAGEDSYLTLERGYIEGVGTKAVLYRVTLDGATDVLGREDLDEGSEVTPVHKERLLDLSSLEDAEDEEVAGGNPDNVESLAWGPEGELLIGTDDNFSDSQRSLIHTVTLGAKD
ncbi:MAG TPA: esterase-like activity of phytase family protein [Candidatus Corynebacterium avicola]|uniref:Esterase-like activity of phytase family protein n=1 Tax=Candidatus Corynebacterium avicola TaxID=2838527 RepID=A0A9D1RSD7_9CORY|nr:esterase-like activity of phytase family protein [Candidatus Corynebacterium avicola]